MVRKLAVLMVSVALVVAFSGCSDESVVPTTNEQSNTTGVVRGEIDAGGAAFKYIIDPQGADPLVGPFVLYGDNIHYVDSLSALSVDLMIENQGEVSHPLPIGMTFVQFAPEGVTVENPDNDEHGPGAAIQFQFENKDNEWNPGEKSLPRTVLYGVDDGVSIGFISQIVIPEDTTKGEIGGIVWNDLNEDGKIDDGEPGIGGMTVHLILGDDSETTLANADQKWSTTTARDGSYRFEDLDAGFYQVIRDFTDPHWRPTTSTVMHVTLVEKDGVVQDFLLANFGCVAEDVPPPPADTVAVGDYIKVNGEYTNGSDGRIVARSIEVLKCESAPEPEPRIALSGWEGDNGDWDDECDDCDDDDCDDDCDCDYDDDDRDGCHRYLCWGVKNEMFGPVTDIDRDNCAVEVMGSWVHFVWCDNDTVPNDTIPGVSAGGDREWRWLTLDDVEVGDRVRVRVIRHPEDEKLYGYRLKEWNGTPEKVYGKVEHISDSGMKLGVLGVDVEITDDTNICFHD